MANPFMLRRVPLPLRHAPHKPARILVLYQGQSRADVAAIPLWTREILGHFVHPHIAVIDLDQKLHRALQPCVEAAHARGLDDDAIIEIAEACVFQPRHQKSSADGIRLYAILPPAWPSGGGVQAPSETTRSPNFRLR